MRTLLGTLLLAVVCAAEDVVTATLAWETGYVGKIHRRRVKFQPAPPDGVAPPEGLKEGRYARLRIAGKEALLVIGGGRFWIDSDLDGSFEAQRPFYTENKAWSVMRTVTLGDEVLAFLFAGSPSGEVTVSPRSYRLGTAILGGRVRKVALSDHDGDLRFTDADHFLVDLSGDGRLKEIKEGEPVRIGSRGYVASVPDATGAVVEFRTVEVPPAEARKWERRFALSAGRSLTKASKPLDELRREYEQKKPLSYSARSSVLTEIARCQSDEAFALLLRIARSDPDRMVRGRAAEAMGYKVYSPHLATIRRLLNSSTPDVVAGALNALHGVDDPDREKFYLRHLKAPNETVAGTAARMLGYLGTPAARAALLKVARSGSGDVRRDAYRALRYFSEPPPTKLMLRAAQGDDASIRAEALEDLAAIGHPDARKLVRRAASEDPLPHTIAYALVDILQDAADAEAVRILLSLGSQSSEYLLKRVRAAILPLRGPEITAEFVRALKHKSPGVRALAAEALAGIPEDKVAAALATQARREKEARVRDAMFEALGDLGDPKSIPVLLKKAKAKDPVAIRALARCGLGDARVRSFFLKMLDSSRWKNRIYALDAAGLSGQAALVDKVAPNLGHKEWRVRLAAAEALGRLRFKESIPPLIDRLGPEEHKRVRSAIGESLFLLTAQDFRDFGDAWRRWWSERAKDFVVPKRIPVRAPSQSGTGASFFGLPVGSGRVVFVIDKSGSMSASDRRTGKTRLERAADEVIAAVGRLKDHDRVEIVFFDSSSHPWQRQLVKLTTSRRAALQRHVRQQTPSGGTNIYDPLEAALQLKEVDTVFLLSDGVPGSGKFVATHDILRAVRRINQTRRVAVHGIAVGTDSELLKKLADQNGGKYARR
ncbi:MAG: HEAT repeat domain-containing protein [Planctomycetota bacterium]